MKKHMLCILLVLSIGILISGCSSQSEGVVPEDFSEYEDTTNQLITDAAEISNSAATEDTETDVVEDAKSDEPEKIILAKTYQQVYPQLYTFYDEDPDYTYSKWIFSLDNQSGFVGSIFMKDGTVITSTRNSNDDDMSINYDRSDGTSGIGGGSTGNIPNGGSGSGAGGQGNTGTGGSASSGGSSSTGNFINGNTGNTDTGNEDSGSNTAGNTGGNVANPNNGSSGAGGSSGNGNSGGKEVGDKTKNPLGKDTELTSPNGDYNVKVSTKVIPQAIVDELNSTPYILAFSVQSKKYRIVTDTIEGSNEFLLEDGIYDTMRGRVSIDSNRVLKTDKGVFSTYIFTDASTQKTYDYAVTYIPKYSANTVYTLYADKMENNENIYSMMQQMISEE